DDLERRLPETVAVGVGPLGLGPLVETGAEANGRRGLEIGPERPRKHAGQLLGVPAPLRADRSDRVRLLQQRVAVAVRVEHLTVYPGRSVAGQVHNQWRHVVRVALGPPGQFARPFAG